MKKFLLLLLCVVMLFSACTKAEPEKGIDLYGTYDENDLFIDEITESLNNGDEIKIPQIKGLENTKLQDKINTEIYNKAKELIEKHSPVNYANYYTRANFANVISISFSVGFEEEPYSESLYLNYNLVDGNELKLEDLFTKDANLTDIIRHAIYTEMALYGGYDKDTFIHYPDEAEVYKITKAYLSDENKDFSFSPSGIFLYPKNHFAEIKMADYASDIVIYSKYITKKSIFTGEYEGFKNAFTCSDTNYDLFDTIEYGYVENNLWCDITTSEDYFPDEETHLSQIEIFKKFSAQKFEEMKQQLDIYHTLAKENPDKFYIVLFKPHFSLYKDGTYNNGEWYYSYSDMAQVSNQVFFYSMPMNVYEEIYRDKIIETYRYQYFAMRGGAFLEEPVEENVEYEEISSVEAFNYRTGEKLTEISDVFDEGSDYMSFIEDTIIKKLVAQNYSRTEAKELCYDMKLVLDGDKVNVTLPHLTDFSADIYISNFEKEYFKLF